MGGSRPDETRNVEIRVRPRGIIRNPLLRRARLRAEHARGPARFAGEQIGANGDSASDAPLRRRAPLRAEHAKGPARFAGEPIRRGADQRQRDSVPNAAHFP
jgi:hypothetical protein